jgi:hypothetical protein
MSKMNLYEWWEKADIEQRNILIAEKVMGWTRGWKWKDASGKPTPYTDSFGELGYFDPSVDMSYAWVVCEHLNHQDSNYQAWTRFHGEMDLRAGSGLWSLSEEQACEAVCLAALAAVGVTEVEERESRTDYLYCLLRSREDKNDALLAALQWYADWRNYEGDEPAVMTKRETVAVEAIEKSARIGEE